MSEEKELTGTESDDGFYFVAEAIRKARMLDRLVDEAADYCALRANNSDVHYDARIAQHFAVEIFSQCSDQRWYEEGNSEHWAEAEARLRNGECWHLFGEGE